MQLLETHPEHSSTYRHLLSLASQSPEELRQLIAEEKHFVLQCLLRVQATKNIDNHHEAIRELYLCKSAIRSMMRDTVNSRSEQSYKKVFVCILGNCVSRCLADKRYDEANDNFKELLPELTTLECVRQMNSILFSVPSLSSFVTYKVQTNSEFKCRVKMAAKKMVEAREIFEKIVARNRNDNMVGIIAKVYQCLNNIESGKYTHEIKKLIEKGFKGFEKGEREAGDLIMSKLIDIEMRLACTEVKPKISKQMFQFYLTKVINMQPKISYLQELKASIETETNQEVNLEILANSKLSKEAEKFYHNIFDSIFQITTKFYFRKMLNISVPQNHHKSNVTYLPLRQKSSKHQSEVSSFKSKTKNYIYPERFLIRCLPRDSSRAEQIMRKCMLGSYLSKANYGNNSLVKKYVRIEEKELCWSDDASDIEFSSSKCKWKHVLGITYGKTSKNLHKEKLQYLVPWKCFSLICHDRSFDFYCEDENEMYFWLQGISYKLQLFNQSTTVLNYPFYSKGRALWKMMLMKIGWNYRIPKKQINKQTNKETERQIKCENAWSVVCFGKSESSKKSNRSSKK